MKIHKRGPGSQDWAEGFVEGSEYVNDSALPVCEPVPEGDGWAVYVHDEVDHECNYPELDECPVCGEKAT